MQYTVALMRSVSVTQHVTQEQSPEDADRVYVALVDDASDEIDAVSKAKLEACAADQEDLDSREDVDPDDDPDAPCLSDYSLLFVIPGSHPPVLWGFQPH